MPSIPVCLSPAINNPRLQTPSHLFPSLLWLYLPVLSLMLGKLHVVPNHMQEVLRSILCSALLLRFKQRDFLNQLSEQPLQCTMTQEGAKKMYLNFPSSTARTKQRSKVNDWQVCQIHASVWEPHRAPPEPIGTAAVLLWVRKKASPSWSQCSNSLNPCAGYYTD